MKDLRPPYTRVLADGTVQCYCSSCGAYRAETGFYASMRAKKARRCKACCFRKQQQQQRRASTAAGRMLHSVRARLRAEGQHELGRAWELSDVEAVLDRFGHCPPYFAKGRLCLVRIDPAAPLRPDNARPMFTRRARGRHHCRPGGGERGEMRRGSGTGGGGAPRFASADPGGRVQGRGGPPTVCAAPP